MKEIALLGTNGHVMGNVLGALLARGLGVNAMVDFPEKVMLADSRLTVTHFNPADRGKTEASLQGYTEAVLTYNDDLEDKYTNELTLKYFVDTVLAARRAGVERVIVVGAQESGAYFLSGLRRLDNIDWVFISTEGDYAGRTALEIEEPTFHKEPYSER